MQVEVKEITTYVYARPFFFNPETSETNVDTVDKQPENPIRTLRRVPTTQYLKERDESKPVTGRANKLCDSTSMSVEPTNLDLPIEVVSNLILEGYGSHAHTTSNEISSKCSQRKPRVSVKSTIPFG